MKGFESAGSCSGSNLVGGSTGSIKMTRAAAAPYVMASQIKVIARDALFITPARWSSWGV